MVIAGSAAEQQAAAQQAAQLRQQQQQLAAQQAARQQQQQQAAQQQAEQQSAAQSGYGAPGSGYSQAMAQRSSPSVMDVQLRTVSPGMVQYYGLMSDTGQYVAQGQPFPRQVTNTGGNATVTPGAPGTVTTILPSGVQQTFGRIDQPVLKTMQQMGDTGGMAPLVVSRGDQRVAMVFPQTGFRTTSDYTQFNQDLPLMTPTGRNVQTGYYDPLSRSVLVANPYGGYTVQQLQGMYGYNAGLSVSPYAAGGARQIETGVLGERTYFTPQDIAGTKMVGIYRQAQQLLSQGEIVRQSQIQMQAQAKAQTLSPITVATKTDTSLKGQIESFIRSQASTFALPGATVPGREQPFDIGKALSGEYLPLPEQRQTVNKYFEQHPTQAQMFMMAPLFAIPEGRVGEIEFLESIPGAAKNFYRAIDPETVAEIERGSNAARGFAEQAGSNILAPFKGEEATIGGRLKTIQVTQQETLDVTRTIDLTGLEPPTTEYVKDYNPLLTEKIMGKQTESGYLMRLENNVLPPSRLAKSQARIEEIMRTETQAQAQAMMSLEAPDISQHLLVSGSRLMVIPSIINNQLVNEKSSTFEDTLTRQAPISILRESSLNIPALSLFTSPLTITRSEYNPIVEPVSIQKQETKTKNDTPTIIGFITGTGPVMGQKTNAPNIFAGYSDSGSIVDVLGYGGRGGENKIPPFNLDFEPVKQKRRRHGKKQSRTKTIKYPFPDIAGILG